MITRRWNAPAWSGISQPKQPTITRLPLNNITSRDRGQIGHSVDQQILLTHNSADNTINPVNVIRMGLLNRLVPTNVNCLVKELSSSRKRKLKNVGMNTIFQFSDEAMQSRSRRHRHWRRHGRAGRLGRLLRLLCDHQSRVSSGCEVTCTPGFSKPVTPCYRFRLVSPTDKAIPACSRGQQPVQSSIRW